MLFAAPAWAQVPAPGTATDYLSKTINIIVPFTAGSATDIMARVVGERLSAGMGQAVIVENRPGAGGTLGTAQVAKSEPDGYTLLVVSTGHVVSPALYGSLPSDPVGDFSGVSPLAALPSVRVVGAGSPLQSVSDLITLAKSKPGRLNDASAGVGSATHVNAEKFLAVSGIQVTPIPFKGTPETLVQVSSGRVDVVFTPVLASIPLIRDKRMRALAVSTSKRSTAVPEVPTVAEAALPGLVFDFWTGLLAPAKTSRAIVNKLNAEVRKVMAQPGVAERLVTLGAESLPVTPERFDTHIQEEFSTLGAIMKTAPK